MSAVNEAPKSNPELTVVLATSNLGKIDEFRSLIEGLPVTVLASVDLGLSIDIEETGMTFEENALLKARAYATEASYPSIADDSGLCVDALDGRPGVYSARFGGLAHSATARNLLLLESLAGIPESERGAEFVCCIAYSDPKRLEWTVKGRVRGTITEEPRGVHGFGYDPVFLLPPLGKTFAELTSEQKNQVSHRAIAIKNARYHIERMLTLLE